MARVTATVLFTDLVGSTELRGHPGEEAAEEVQLHGDQILHQPIEGKGGPVHKHRGDGLMATLPGVCALLRELP